MKDKSVLNHSSAQIDDKYINECIKEVCLKGDSITKYQPMIEKQYGPDFYLKCDSFIRELKRSVKKKKFSETSLNNLNYLANEIYVSHSTIDSIVAHYKKKFDAYYKQKERENNERIEAALQKDLERQKEEERQKQAKARQEKAAEQRRLKKIEEEKIRRQEEKRQQREEEIVAVHGGFWMSWGCFLFKGGKDVVRLSFSGWTWRAFRRLRHRELPV